MASDKNSMLSCANSYIGKVTAAKNACESAIRYITPVVNEVSDCWNGASGDTMVQALNQLAAEINKVYSRLDVLESGMRSQATYIYNTWPKEQVQDASKASANKKASTQTSSKQSKQSREQGDGGLIEWLKKLF